MSNVEERLERIECKLDLVLYGPPDDSAKGLLVRVDRLEQTEKTRGKVLWALFTGLLGLGFEAFRGLWK